MRRLQTTLAAGAAALAGVVASPAAAGSSLLHIGMNDPATEGFTKSVVGTDPTPAPGDDGLPYWEIDASDPGTTFLSYTVPQFDSTLSAILMAPGGWMLSATARVLETSGGLPSVSVSDTFTGGVSGGGDAWYFALVLNAGSPAQSTLSYLNNVNQLTPLTTLDVSQYHDYEFTLDPGANAAGIDDQVEVRVDGSLVGTLPRTLIADQNLSPSLRFGDNSGGHSRSRWNRVEFTAVPEPARPLLILVAATALCLARPRGSPARIPSTSEVP